MKWFAWILTYWPVTLPLLFMGVYELFALATKVTPLLGPKRPTITALVRKAHSRWKPLPYVVIPVMVILVAHFFFGLW
jgi:hypothetical protein